MNMHGMVSGFSTGSHAHNNLSLEVRQLQNTKLTLSTSHFMSNTGACVLSLYMSHMTITCE